MQDWKDILKTAAGKLTAGLAFALLMLLAVAQFGDRLLPEYRALPYLLIGLGYLVYVVIEIRRARQPQTRGGDIATGQDVRQSVQISGHNNHITYIIGATQGADKALLRRQIRDYLNWAAETFGVITLRGIEQGGRQVVELPLDTVYVPLQAAYSPEELRQMQEEQQKEEPQRTVALNQALGLGPRLILTGGPGSGKTTVLQHIAWTLAEAIRTDDPALAEKKLGLRPPLPLPIYVPLSLYAAYRRDLPADAPAARKTLAAFIAEYLIQSQTSLDLDEAFFRSLLQDQRRVLLLLDGMDEVPNESERARVRQDIERLVAGKENLRVVVTSRTAAYQGRAVLGRGFRHLRVLPLEDEQIAVMVQQAYRAIHPQAPALAKKKSGDLLRGIARLEADRRQRLGKKAEPLVDTPIMVRLLLIVHFNNRRLPDQRADLYQRAVDAMLRPDYNLDENVKDDLEHRIGGTLALNREMLQYLAFHMHARGAEQGREIEEAALRAILGKQEAYAPYVDELISLTRQRGTLLEERGGLYRFLHLSFQEFLTARYLITEMHEAEKIVSFLENGDKLRASWWREPILLAAGYLDVTAPSRLPPLLTRLAGLDEAALEKVQRRPWEDQLAAAELAAVAYQECQNRTETLRRKLRDRLQTFFRAETQAKAAFPPVLLAAAADELDRLGYTHPDLYRFVEIGMRKAEGKNSSFIIPHSPFYLALFPVTNAQYARFLTAEDYADPDLWRDFPRFSHPQEAEDELRLETIHPLTADWGDAGLKWLKNPRDWFGNKREKNDDGVVIPEYWHDSRFGLARLSAPVVGVSWYEANAYCKWLLRHWDELEESRANPGLQPALIRLPTEAEWVAAAGGFPPPNPPPAGGRAREGGDRYPWEPPDVGVNHDLPQLKDILRRANVDESGIGRTTPVWTYPLGRSFGASVWDLSGNVWEWQVNFYNDAPHRLALRGGSWGLNHHLARVAARGNYIPLNSNNFIGFRVGVFLAPQ